MPNEEYYVLKRDKESYYVSSLSTRGFPILYTGRIEDACRLNLVDALMAFYRSVQAEQGEIGLRIQKVPSAPVTTDL